LSCYILDLFKAGETTRIEFFSSHNVMKPCETSFTSQTLKLKVSAETRRMKIITDIFVETDIKLK